MRWRQICSSSHACGLCNEAKTAGSVLLRVGKMCPAGVQAVCPPNVLLGCLKSGLLPQYGRHTDLAKFKIFIEIPAGHDCTLMDVPVKG